MEIKTGYWLALSVICRETERTEFMIDFDAVYAWSADGRYLSRIGNAPLSADENNAAWHAIGTRPGANVACQCESCIINRRGKRVQGSQHP